MLSGKSQDATSFNRFSSALVHCVYGRSLSAAFDTTVDAPSFFRILCMAHGTGWSVPWSQLTWTNEIMPIKQVAPVVLTLFSGFGYMVLLFVGFMLLSGWMLGFCGYVICFVNVNVFLSVWFYLWLRERGVGRFAAL